MKPLLVVALVACSALQLAAQKPRVYVEESQSWEVSGSVGGSGDAVGGSVSGGARPQTAEIIKTFSENCANVTVNNRKEKADYIVLLHHEGGKDLIRRDNKVAVFNHDGDNILSRSTRTLGNSVKDACAAITRDWAANRGRVNASVEEAPIDADVSRLEIASTPTGADIEVNGEFVGSTPSAIHLKPGEYKVVVAKKGYATWERKVKVTGGSVNLVAELQEQK